jgi:CheY-like chemotaxis protein
MSNVLIAATPQTVVSLERILGRWHELVVANTLGAALANLEEKTFDLVIVDIAFDNSQMFRLLGELRLSEKNAQKPIICFSARETEMPRVVHESIEIASKSAGAWMYLEQKLYNVYKDPDDELRRIIERCLTAEARNDIYQHRIDIQKQRGELQQLRLLLRKQAWSKEQAQYLAGLRHDLELLLDEVSKLNLSSDVQRSKITASRDLKDRVSDQVTLSEDMMTRRESIQSLDEDRLSIQEEALASEEESRSQQVRQTDSKNTDEKKVP